MTDKMTDRKLFTTEHYDYEHQAWVGTDGRYLSCAHLPEHNCACYGRIHAGELAKTAVYVDVYDIRHSEPHSPASPCSPFCTGYAPTQAVLKAQKAQRAARRNTRRRANDQARRTDGRM